MEKIAISFDRKGNTLDIWFDKPNKEFTCEETGEEIILKKDKNGNVIGIEILNFLPKPEEKLEIVQKIIPIKATVQKVA